MAFVIRTIGPLEMVEIILYCYLCHWLKYFCACIVVSFSMLSRAVSASALRLLITSVGRPVAARSTISSVQTKAPVPKVPPKVVQEGEPEEIYRLRERLMVEFM